MSSIFAVTETTIIDFDSKIPLVETSALFSLRQEIQKSYKIANIKIYEERKLNEKHSNREASFLLE